jgi:hypothetical protein
MVVTISPGTEAFPIEFPGPLKAFESGWVNSTPGSAQDLLTVPGVSGMEWRLRRIELVSRAYSVWTLKKDAGVIKTGYTSPAESAPSVPIEPWEKIVFGNTVVVTYSQDNGPILPVYARVFYTEHVL